jgi:hypothetical protein
MDSAESAVAAAGFRIEYQQEGAVPEIVGTANDVVQAHLRAVRVQRELAADGADGNLVVIDQRYSGRGQIAGTHRMDEYRRLHTD